MEELRFRPSYRFKIFSIAITLVFLMACVTTVSIHLVDRIETRLSLLAESYAPLSNQLADLEVTALRQEIVFERLVLLLEEGAGDTPHFETEQQRFVELGVGFDAVVAEARTPIQAGLTHIESIDAISELTRVDASLEAISREHQDWQDHATRIVQEAMAGTAIAGVLWIVEDESRDYAEAIDRLRAEMETYTLQAAATARDDERRLHQVDVSLTIVAAVLGLLLSALFTAGLIRPVHALLGGMRDVEAGGLDTTLKVTSHDELGQLIGGFNTMVGELRTKERIKETFGRFVDPRIVRDLIDRPEMMESGGERRQMTILFSDVAGFTSISEQLSPDDLVTLLNAYLTEMSRPIQEERGVIDKFIGDAILAYWGVPFVPEEEQATRACRAALRKRDLIAPFQASLPHLLGLRDNAPRVDLRIGIATGPVIVGTIGSAQSRNFTVIGDTVNVGARLEAACKLYKVRTLVDEPTVLAAGDSIATREIDTIRLVGKKAPVRVFQLLDLSDQLTPVRAALKDSYEVGLQAYREQRWDDAEERFKQCLELESDDGPAHTMLRRVDVLRVTPPAPDWQGTWTQQHK